MTETVPGFRYTRHGAWLDFGLLSRTIEWEQRSITMYGRRIPLPRLTAMYGAQYTYSGIHHPARPFPPLLESLRARMAAQLGVPFNAALCNFYEDGSRGVSWHDDNDYPTACPTIASLSFGATRRFLVRRKGDHRRRHTFQLEHGSLLVMDGRSQDDWDHCIPKTKRKVGPRINVTLRCIDE